MIYPLENITEDYDPRFKIFHELMAKKVRDVLLVSTPYNAWIMEEDVRLSERIIHEYRGLNLSNPPRLTWVSSDEEALTALKTRSFDMVITMPNIADENCFALGKKVKEQAPDLPVILLAHSVITSVDFFSGHVKPTGIDRAFIWSGDTDILVALIKSAEDRLNVEYDTSSAGIRVLLFIEDSPQYLSSLLPIFYREIVSQTQAVMEEGLNMEHMLLTMRARPKILIAENYEDAMTLYEQFKPYILGVISDGRFPREGKLCPDSGIDLLSKIKSDRWDIPLLLMSSEPSTAEKVVSIPSFFIDKNSSTLHADVHAYFMEHLGFGDFIFKMPDGREVSRAGNLRSLEKELGTIPDESLLFHAGRNDFSQWLFARTEIILASTLRPASLDDFSNDPTAIRKFLVDAIQERRRSRQKGIIANFDSNDFDPDIEFYKIDRGSIGEKARGLAFASDLFRVNSDLIRKFREVKILFPKSLIITTDVYDAFINDNHLTELADTDLSEKIISENFQQVQLPKWILNDLKIYLNNITCPIAVRTSSSLECGFTDSQSNLPSSVMLSNNDPSIDLRLEHLIQAIKSIYFSIFFRKSKTHFKNIDHRPENEKIALLIQNIAGKEYGDFFSQQFPESQGLIILTLFSH